MPLVVHVDGYKITVIRVNQCCRFFQAVRLTEISILNRAVYNDVHNQNQFSKESEIYLSNFYNY